MGEMTMAGSGFVGYEYKDITVSRDVEPLYQDNYGHFGWKLEKITPTIYGAVNLKFKRDRRIKNKLELTRLQRKFDNCISQLIKLEASKTTTPSIVAYCIGLAGTAFMAGSVFAVVGGNIPLCIILAIPAFVGWGLGYLMYKKLVNKHTEMAMPMIDGQYNEIYDICEQANALLV